MKKLFFALVGVVMVVSNAVAQNYEKNLYGVRAGLNVSNMSMQGLSANSKAGFHIAGVYQRLLAESLPIYLETGLQFSQKGCKWKYDYDKTTLNAWYIEIPLMVNYKFNIKDIATVYPSVGFFYAYGIGGKYKEDYMDDDTMVSDKYDMFGKEAVLKHSDLGMRFSATVDWKRYSFSLGYEFGFIDVMNEAFSEDGLKVKTGNFFLSLGYNF